MPEPLIPISRKRAYLFAIFLVAYEFLTYVANDMIMPGMIDVVHSFNAPESMVATSLTIYILGGASLQLFLGPFSDAYGRRPAMLFGAMLFLVFTLLIAQSMSIETFLMARFFQGMGLCFIGVIGYATIQEIFSEMDAIRLIAIMGNAAILAPLLGPLMGAFIIVYASWRAIFIMIAMCSVVTLWGLWRFMPESVGAKRVCADVVPKIPFVPKHILNSYRALLSNPAFCFTALAISFLGVPCIVWIALAPIILIKDAHLSVIDYGLWQLPVFGATIVGNIVLHRLTNHYTLKKIVFLGAIIMSIGMTLTTVLSFFFGNNYLVLLPGTIIYFLSLSIIHAPLNRYCLFVTRVGKGTASALISLAVMMIGAAGIELGRYVYEGHNNVAFGLYGNFITLLFLIFALRGFKEKASNG
jgi:DHA1 family multidrug/chloramphenicol efflux transport protein-like MFS transporter